MSGAKEYLQVKFLKTLEPLSSLSVDKLEEIANKSQIQELQAGRIIFRQGEKDSRSTYLLSGQVELQVTGNPRTEILKAKTADTRYPIAQEWPRPSTCRSKTNVVLLHIDSDLLEILLSTDPSGTYEVTEIGVQEDPESDWMLRFLQSPAFLQLPTDNIQSILVKLEEMNVNTGDVIIKQGESDDYYYIVKQGKCSVSRRPAPKMDEVRLAILGPGDGFGEEALITNGKRNATVTAKEAGIVMRLSKNDFHNLLVEPMMREVDHDTLMSKVKTGAALVDVRTNKEYGQNGIQGSQNIPLSMLRMKAKDLNKTREHILYCDDGTQSRAAAFLLAQQGLDVYVLQGGLNSQTKPFSPAVTPKAVTESTSSAAIAKPIMPAPAPAAPVTTAKSSQPATGNKIMSGSIPASSPVTSTTQSKPAPALFNKPAEQTHNESLREKSNALLAQADRLAQKTAHAEEARRKTQEEIDALKKEALEQRQKILDAAQKEMQKGKEYAKQQQDEANKIRKEAEEARKNAEAELERIRNQSKSLEQKHSDLTAELKRAELEKQQAERAADVARLIAQQEANTVKAEAETLRKQAMEEAERLREQAKQDALKEAEHLRYQMEQRKSQIIEAEKLRQQQAIEEARRNAELSRAEVEKEAEERRRQAAIEADAIRKQAIEEAERLRVELEKEKRRAAEQSARLKAEEEARRQQLELEHKKAIEAARIQAQREAELIRKEAILKANRQAKEEAKRMAQIEADQIRQQAIEKAQQEAYEKAQRLAAEAQAEADSIRRQALEQANLERQQALKAAEDEARRQREAEESSKLAMQTAQLEADAIRQAAIEEANRLREEMETTRKMVETQAARARAKIEQEEALRKAEQEARTQAAKAAALLAIQEAERRANEETEAEELARQAALAELEQQRIAEEQAYYAEEQRRIAAEQAHQAAELEQRRIAEEQARLAAELEQRRKADEQARQAAELEQRRKAEEQARLLAEQAVQAEENARFAAELEEQCLAEERAFLDAELQDQRVAEEQARIAAQVERQRQAAALRQDVARFEAQQKAQVQELDDEFDIDDDDDFEQEERELKAEQMARALRSKLDKHKSSAQQMDEEFQVSMGRGPKLAKAKLHVVKDKTILEGEEDIFIFKAPSARPPSREEAEKLLQQAEAQLAEKSRNELPTFDLDYADDEPANELVIEQESEFSDSILLELDNITANSAPPSAPHYGDDEHFAPIKEAVAEKSKLSRSRSSLIALAASIVIMVTISIVAVTRPTHNEVEEASAVSEQQPRGLAAIRSRTTNNREALEDKLKNEAENDFNKMLAKWRSQNQ